MEPIDNKQNKIAKKYNRFGLKLIAWSATVGLGSLAWVYASHVTVNAYSHGQLWFQAQVAEAKESLSSWLDLRPLEVLVEPPQVSPLKLIDVISREEGVSTHIVLAMAMQESGSKLRTDRVRFEPHLMKIFKGKQEAWMTNEIERQMVASSHGLLQVVYGWHAKTCGLNSYAELYQPAINIRCGIRVLKQNLNDVSKIKSKLIRLREALARYNGGTNPPAQSYAYADSVLKRYVELVIEDSGEAI